MKRRTFIQSLGALLYLPFIKVRPVQAQIAYDGLIYSDSENTAPALLEALGDLITGSGGIRYAA
jgi:hypothetical protein